MCWPYKRRPDSGSGAHHQLLRFNELMIMIYCSDPFSPPPTALLGDGVYPLSWHYVLQHNDNVIVGVVSVACVMARQQPQCRRVTGAFPAITPIRAITMPAQYNYNKNPTNDIHKNSSTVRIKYFTCYIGIVKAVAYEVFRYTLHAVYLHLHKNYPCFRWMFRSSFECDVLIFPKCVVLFNNLKAMPLNLSTSETGIILATFLCECILFYTNRKWQND